MERACRCCKTLLTIENIYPSDLKHNNWICKECSGNKKRERLHRNNQPSNKSDDQDMLKAFDISTVTKHASTANYNRSNNTSTQRACCNCEAYDNESHTCRLNPPMINGFPKVAPYDYCVKFVNKPCL